MQPRADLRAVQPFDHMPGCHAQRAREPLAQHGALRDHLDAVRRGGFGAAARRSPQSATNRRASIGFVANREITGIGMAATARATRSLLNAQRSHRPTTSRHE